MSRITIILEEADLLALQEALMDDDPDAALAFLKEHLAAKIPEKGRMPCDSSRHNTYLLGKGVSKRLTKD